MLIDATPLLGQRSGIGRYTAALLRELATRPDMDVTVIALTARGQIALRAAVPPGVAVRGGPVPARALRVLWRHMDWPPAELLAADADVLHAPNFVLPPSKRARGVVTVHDLAFLDRPDFLAPPQRDLPDLVERSVARAAVVCTPSDAVAQQVARRLDIPPQRIVVTPLGVDSAWFGAAAPTAARRTMLRLPPRYLLFVGAAQPRKGLDVLLEAHRSQPDLAPLVLAGPAGWGPAHRASSRVLTLGFLDEADLRCVVAGATALVLPSRDEGFGLPVLEAMAAGVPVVCSDLPALREVAGGLATCVRPGDPAALAAALAAVDGVSVDPVAAAARRAHAARYTWQVCAEATVRAYQLARA
ncbi:MAG: glycosyltransferase family 4 protein [Actinomycetota bacterium]|nr:glycosyltransferase family 4 protein [Actinomycetota bacterium]